jgi:hypothetical protein
MFRYALALSVLLAVTALPVRAAAPGCTVETLKVRGTPVTIGYCIVGATRSDGNDEVIVPVAATYGSPNGSFSRNSDLRFVAGERVSRILENFQLAKVGMTGVLHLTLAYGNGTVRIEGALLTPGAITIK